MGISSYKWVWAVTNESACGKNGVRENYFSRSSIKTRVRVWVRVSAKVRFRFRLWVDTNESTRGKNGDEGEIVWVG